MCIQLNNTWCVIFKVKSIHFCLIYCIKYNNIKVKFSYERKTRIKENDSVEHTNNDIKYYLELNLLIPCFQCHRCDYHSYIMITYRNRIRYLNHINKKNDFLNNVFFNTLGHKCAEFNLGGNSIQPLYETNCSQFIPPFLFRYCSLFAYKCTLQLLLINM